MLAAVAALAAGAGCTSDGRSSAEMMGQWVQSDAKTFQDDLRAAPDWFHQSVTSDSRDFVTAFNLIVSNTADEARHFQDSMSTLHSDIAASVRNDSANLASDVAAIRTSVHQDARTFSDDLNGAPAYIADQNRRDLNALNDHVDMIYDQLRKEWEGFPESMRFWFLFLFFE